MLKLSNLAGFWRSRKLPPLYTFGYWQVTKQNMDCTHLRQPCAVLPSTMWNPHTLIMGQCKDRKFPACCKALLVLPQCKQVLPFCACFLCLHFEIILCSFQCSHTTPSIWERTDPHISPFIRSFLAASSTLDFISISTLFQCWHTTPSVWVRMDPHTSP